MPVGWQRYGKSALPETHAVALDQAFHWLIDSSAMDIALLLGNSPFSSTTMAQFVPRKFLLRYDIDFAKKFFVCMTTVAWKFHARGLHKLACTAEEMALGAAVRSGRARPGRRTSHCRRSLASGSRWRSRATGRARR